MKLARRSGGIGRGMGEPFRCGMEWPEDCFVQCGDAGLVFAKEGNYTTAFFEAFPRNPNAFFRGEGKTVEHAEVSCWEQYRRALACAGHEFERKNYRNGLGVCKHCGLCTMAFDPTEHCVICDVPTCYTSDVDDNWYCQKHKGMIPENKKTEAAKLMESALASLRDQEEPCSHS